MTNTFSFQIVTPEEIAYENEIESATIPTEDGEITILARHTPLVSTLAPGELRIRRNGETTPLAVGHGFVEVRDDGRVIIIAGTAERPEEIDIAQARAARDRARRMLEEQEHLDDEQFAKFESILERELARIKVGTKYGRK